MPAPERRRPRLNPFSIALAAVAISGIVGGMLLEFAASTASTDWTLGYADSAAYAAAAWTRSSATWSKLLLVSGVVGFVGCLVVEGVAWDARRRR
ncbi:hypothetical protein GCM10010988_02690 [Cnuibacter physcomitrellae]|nr:hypothetical protein GCM10010988_02690 [Cnuibacter physcomitrellae]